MYEGEVREKGEERSNILPRYRDSNVIGAVFGKEIMEAIGLTDDSSGEGTIVETLC